MAEQKPEPSEFAKKLMAAFGEATHDAVISHLKAGRAVVYMKDGKEFWLKPEDLDLFLKSRE